MVRVKYIVHASRTKWSHRIFVGRVQIVYVYRERCRTTYSLRHLHISTFRLYIDIRACTVKHICTCTARVKSVRINWQTLNSLYVYEPCTHTTSDEMLFQVGKNASDQKHYVFEMPYFIASHLLFKYNE